MTRAPVTKRCELAWDAPKWFVAGVVHVRSCLAGLALRARSGSAGVLAGRTGERANDGMRCRVCGTELRHVQGQQKERMAWKLRDADVRVFIMAAEDEPSGFQLWHVGAGGTVPAAIGLSDGGCPLDGRR